MDLCCYIKPDINQTVSLCPSVYICCNSIKCIRLNTKKGAWLCNVSFIKAVE